MDNKKLLVLSDTHGRLSYLQTVLNWAKDRIPPKDVICLSVFLGDGISDLHQAVKTTGYYSDWKLVRGNNDYGSQYPESDVFDFVNFRFFICHGHRHSLYSGYHSLINAAVSNGANVVLSGHSHVPHFKNMNGIQLINPGSAGSPRSKIGATFAVIECAEGKKLNVEFWGINEKGIVKVKLP